MREDEDVEVINDLAEREVEKNIYNLDWMQSLEMPCNRWHAKHMQELLGQKWQEEVC